MYEIAENPLNIFFIGIDKSTADSLFTCEYNEKQFAYFLGNKVEGINLDTASFKTDAVHSMKRQNYIWIVWSIKINKED